MELPFERPDGDWQPVSRPALIAWLIFFGLLLLQAARAKYGEYLLFDWVNFFPHEGGHFLFSYLGDTMMILGGTITQLLVPFLLTVYFVWHRKTPAVGFCSFWFFENFLNIGTYMMDARIQNLALVGPGGGGPESHDWTNLFAMWNLLDDCWTIGRATRTVGWIGMPATCVWLVWIARRQWAPAIATQEGAGISGARPEQFAQTERVAEASAVQAAAAAAGQAGGGVVDSTTRPASPLSSAGPRGSETILLVETDAGVRQALGSALRRRGYAVLEAADASQALEADKRYQKHISLLITGPLPGSMDAMELASRLRLENPDIRLLFTLGQGDSQAVRSLLPEGCARVRKPFTTDQLAQAIRQELDRACAHTT